MTDKELRVELAKAALIGGASKIRMNEMYEWCKGDDNCLNLDYENKSVYDLEPYLGNAAVRFRNRCHNNDIKTIGELVRLGSGNFLRLQNVGINLVEKVREALFMYGIKGW